MKTSNLFFAFVLFASLQSMAEEFAAKVTKVIDGNTVELLSAENEVYKIVLVGIDCPELEQNHGMKAKKYLEKLLLDRNVLVKIHGKDRWGNRLGEIIVDGEEDPRHLLLKEGLAWTSEKNPHPQLEAVKEAAREKKKGLWEEENPTPPWTFRRQQTALQPKSS